MPPVIHPPENTTDSADEFDIAREVTQLMDALPDDKKVQVMAALNKRYEKAIRASWPAQTRAYGPRHRRKSWKG